MFAVLTKKTALSIARTSVLIQQFFCVFLRKEFWKLRPFWVFQRILWVSNPWLWHLAPHIKFNWRNHQKKFRNLSRSSGDEVSWNVFFQIGFEKWAFFSNFQEWQVVCTESKRAKWFHFTLFVLVAVRFFSLEVSAENVEIDLLRLAPISFSFIPKLFNVEVPCRLQWHVFFVNLLPPA